MTNDTSQRIGYARVSTDDQNLDLQHDALTRAGCSTIYADKASGKDTARPELAHCLKALRPGDTLTVWRLDRLGRSITDLLQIVADLDKRGIAFESIAEKIETGSAAGRLVFHVFAALAEFERGIIRERTRAGLDAARQRGRTGGRKPKMDAKQKAEAFALHDSQRFSIKEICERAKVSRATFYRALATRETETA